MSTMANGLKRGLLVGAMALAGAVGNANADGTYTVSVTSGTLAASAEFTVTGTTLTIVLTNTSGSDVLIPADVLTALFFDLNGIGALTPVSALLTDYGVPVVGSTVLFGPDGAGNVGGEFAYGSGFLAGSSPGGSEGISSAGFGLFGNPNFGGVSLSPPNAVDGLNYGMVSAGDNPASGNSPVTGDVPLIKNSVTFTLTNSGLSAITTDAQLAAALTNVAFQYGTALDGSEPCIGSCTPVRIPEPGLPFLFGAALLAWGATRRFGFRS